MPTCKSRRDDRGSVTVLFALTATVLFAATAIGLDLVTISTAKRQVQTAADLAAILAAVHPDQAQRVARRSVSDNGYAPTEQDLTVVTGTYTAAPERPANGRFVPYDVPANAARVSLRSHAKANFAPLVGLPTVYPVSATGTAAAARFASFTIGSRLASLNGGVANAVIGALLGSQVSLTAVDYDALATANVDALRFLDALAIRAGLTAASFDALMSSSVSVGHVAPALADTLPGGTASQAIGALGQRIVSPSTRLPVSALLPAGDVAPARRGGGMRLDALKTLLDAVTVANGTEQVSVDLGPSLPGITRTRITASVGQRKQSSGMVQVGSAKATLRTGQARLLVEAVTTFGAGTLTLPVYVEAAYATGMLASISCPWQPDQTRSVTVNARPGVVDLAIASVPGEATDLDKPPPSLTGEVTLLSVPLATVKGSARVTWNAGEATPLSFSESDILQGRVRRVSSTNALGSAVEDLLARLRLSVEARDTVSASILERSLRTSLGSIAPSIDNAIDTTLAILGVRLGSADVSVDGTRCEGAVLVQ